MDANIKTDYIHIRGLRLSCRIGVSARERRKKQVIIADLSLDCALAKAAKSDCLKDTLDYSVLAGKISALAAGEEFCLLEALAGRIAEKCLADSKVRAVTVKVAKQGVLPNVGSIGVEIKRRR